MVKTLRSLIPAALLCASALATTLAHAADAHTDAAREWAYDRQSSIGKLDKALDEAQAKGWTVVDMKNDWKTIFPPANK